jgi:hypothetical protein
MRKQGGCAFGKPGWAAALTTLLFILCFALTAGESAARRIFFCKQKPPDYICVVEIPCYLLPGAVGCPDSTATPTSGSVYVDYPTATATATTAPTATVNPYPEPSYPYFGERR